MKLSTTTGTLEKKFGCDGAIRMIADAGFDAYDMTMCKIHVSDSPIASDGYKGYIARLKNVADEHGIVCNQSHSPFPSQLHRNDTYNQRTLELTIRSMECTALLGAEVVVVHPNKNTVETHIKEFEFEPYASKAERYEENVKFFRGLVPYCEEYGVKIAVENLFERHPIHRETLIPSILGTAEEHARFINDVDSEWIVGCLDIGHALICGEKPQNAIRVLGGKKLKALHVHDSNGYEDLHQIPGFAKAEWDEIMKALADIRYDGDFTFEADCFFNRFHPDLWFDALVFMNKVGRHLINMYC